MVQIVSKLDSTSVYIPYENRNEFRQWCQHHDIKSVLDYTVRILSNGFIVDNWWISSKDKLVWIKLTWGHHGP